MHIWTQFLFGYYNYDYIINGITNGFRIGIDLNLNINDSCVTRDPIYINLNIHEKKAITQWLLKGVDKGYICGPFSLDYQFPWQLHCSPLFVVPKPGFRKYRPIVHLSWRQRGCTYCINELLCDYMKTVQYISFREVVNLVNNAGKGAYIFLIDAQDAYYRVPIHPSDFKWNGLKWGKRFWVFLSLQMGLSSSPKIYTAFADAVEWICVNQNKDIAFLHGLQQLRHYIDDFFACCRDYKTALKLYNSLFKLMKILGIPTRLDKCTPPATQAKILGWIYDTILRCVMLPNNKRLELIELIRRLLKSRRSDKKSLERLIGKLQHASQIVFPGKAFVRHLEALLYLPGFRYNKPINLTEFVCEDLKWWLNILEKEENVRTSFDLLLKLPSDGDFAIYTDASSKLGVGGHMGNRAFQIPWEKTDYYKIKYNCDNFDIELLELLGSLIAIELWADLFVNKSVTIYNDNPGAAGAIRTKAPRLYRLDMQFLIRRLASIAVDNKFYFWGIHCTANDDPKMDLADALSRFKNAPKYSMQFNNFIDDTKDAIVICNKLLNAIASQPKNLPNNRDIRQLVRQEYNILLDDNLLKSQLIKLDNNVLLQQQSYNILKQ